jgi:hypothetical protein
MVRSWLASLTLLASLAGPALAQAPVPVDHPAVPQPAEDPAGRVVPTARPTNPQPTNFRDTRFWAQGVNLGLEITY